MHIEIEDDVFGKVWQGHPGKSIRSAERFSCTLPGKGKLAFNCDQITDFESFITAMNVSWELGKMIKKDEIKVTKSYSRMLETPAKSSTPVYRPAPHVKRSQSPIKRDETPSKKPTIDSLYNGSAQFKTPLRASNIENRSSKSRRSKEGYINVGQSCYMSAIIHFITSLTLKEHPHPTNRFTDLYTKLLSQRAETCSTNPHSFKREVQALFGWGSNRQEDAHEYFLYCASYLSGEADQSYDITTRLRMDYV